MIKLSKYFYHHSRRTLSFFMSLMLAMNLSNVSLASNATTENTAPHKSMIQLPETIRLGNPVVSIAYSPTEPKMAISINNVQMGQVFQIVIWNLVTNQEELRLGGSPIYSGVTYSPDGRSLASRGSMWIRIKKITVSHSKRSTIRTQKDHLFEVNSHPKRSRFPRLKNFQIEQETSLFFPSVSLHYV